MYNMVAEDQRLKNLIQQTVEVMKHCQKKKGLKWFIFIKNVIKKADTCKTNQ